MHGNFTLKLYLVSFHVKLICIKYQPFSDNNNDNNNDNNKDNDPLLSLGVSQFSNHLKCINA